ncbi:MAG: GNAT family N-acetyltransferase [Lachnospiraceae bacterium]|nr:GNAT family N-acetyltransferase [Lachnospiraceae bacterium]
MYSLYMTENLQLRVLSESDAKMVADFYNRNYDDFKKYEPFSGKNVTTVSFERRLLEAEIEQLKAGQQVRFHVFEKNDPFTVIGTVSLREIKRSCYGSAVLGYKMDQNYRNKGYATEAIKRSIEIVANECELHRIEATVLPDNNASIRVLEKLGFEREGLLREKIFLEGEWKDHYLYGKILD